MSSNGSEDELKRELQLSMTLYITKYGIYMKTYVMGQGLSYSLKNLLCNFAIAIFNTTTYGAIFNPSIMK